MRADMDRLIVECSRHGDKNARILRRRRVKALMKEGDFEALPKRESVRPKGKRWGYWKHMNLGERLQPLYRFVDRSVGRKWDDVYSEIRRNIRADKATHLHILQHLEDRIDVTGRYRSRGLATNYYVCREGFLRRTENPKKYTPISEEEKLLRYLRHRAQAEGRKFFVDGEVIYENINGGWYRLSNDMPAYEYGEAGWWKGYYRRLHYRRTNFTWGGVLYTRYNKVYINKAEASRLGLR